MFTHFDSTPSFYGHPNVGMIVCQWQPILLVQPQTVVHSYQPVQPVAPTSTPPVNTSLPFYRLSWLYLNRLKWVLQPITLNFWAPRLQLLRLVYYNHLYPELFIHKLDFPIMGCHKHNRVLPIHNQVQAILIWAIILVDSHLGRCYHSARSLRMKK